MRNRITAVLVLAGGLATTGGIARTAAAPGQQPGVERQADVPVFRVTVVGHTTPAINYRPRSGATTIDFVGTPLQPQGRGRATVRGKDGAIEIDARFQKLQSATRFGPEYLTYVVWAVTPEGRASNLGELQVDGDDGSLKVTTELQAFGLIVTAEPYFAVTQPSDVVVLENAVRDETVGNIEVIQAKYELLKRGSYLMNQDAGRLKLKPLEPGAPLDLAEARNAVQLARLAGADRYVPETFDKAGQLLAEAENARAARRGGNAIMMPARQAAQTAEDARLIALRRQEEEYASRQRALIVERESAALERARAEEARRRQADEARRDAEARRDQAENQTRAAEEARAAAERAKTEADRARTDADRAAERLAQERRAADEARVAAETARAAAEAEARSSAAQAQQSAAQAEREKAELRDRLREQLNVILETRETARGLIVNLSDVLFDTGSANLKPGAREKLAKIAGILLAHPGLEVQVEGHTDSVGSDDRNQALSERRAQSVHDYLIGQAIPPAAVGTAGFGESQPVASNDTAAGRQQNRRVELVVSGDPIGRRR
jgi:outer membrane protein OmpA-like peptidoglycan-associated protein